MPNPVRRTQAISPFGVGAMVDFPGPVSLIHCGLDAWPFDENNPDHYEFRIQDEERLAGRLGVDYFVLPPDFRFARKGQSSDDKNLNLKLPFLRFPRWHVCPRCGLMHEAELHDRVSPICKGPIGSGADKGKNHPPRKTIQVRFISACSKGHLQDFPWWEWVFGRNDPVRAGRRLRMVSSGSASLAGVRIVCEDISSSGVINSKTLSGAFDKVSDNQSALSTIGVLCQGHNPALSIPSIDVPAPGCGEALQPLLRGGSNVYFPRVVSSIYLPTIDTSASEEVLSILDNSYVWGFLQMMAQANSGAIDSNMAKTVLDTHYPELETSPDELRDAANRKLAGDGSQNDTPLEDEEQYYRKQEYDIFTQDIKEGYPKTNLLIKSEVMDSYGKVITDYFERISLAHKLRETRAFVGYSRIFPDDALSDDERRALFMRTPKNWLPAIIVRGEGVFLKLNEDKLDAWLKKSGDLLNSRISNMQQMFDQLRDSRRQEPRPISPKLVLLHTLSHMIINQLVYDCGYGSASLRERLYCSEGENRMAGILIYTAAGDSEGTMGGLVRMGKPGKLEMVVRKALERAGWCSSDPVCIESTGQGPDNCNLAACHACSLLPETSCEEGNRLLDRAMVVGTIDNPGMGYFS